jgi:hypothetical protein
MAKYLAAIAAAALVAGNAVAQQAADDVDVLTGLIVQTLPFGDAMKIFIDKDPTWPLKAKADKVPAADLKCMRDRLSPDGFREVRTQQVRDFVRRNPDSVPEAIRVLKDGAAKFAGASFMFGIWEAAGASADYKQVLAQLTPKEMSAYVEFVGDEKFRGLRELVGVGDALSLGAKKGDSYARGEQMGRVLGMKMMLEAMDHCHVSLQVLQ